MFLYRFIEIHGFAMPDHMDSYPEFLAEVDPWVSQGKVKYNEEFVEGFDQIPGTFMRLFDGRHSRKLIAKID